MLWRSRGSNVSYLGPGVGQEGGPERVASPEHIAPAAHAEPVTPSLALLIGGRWVRMPGVAAHLAAYTESGWLFQRGSRLCSEAPSAGDRVRVSMGRYARSSARTKETG